MEEKEPQSKAERWFIWWHGEGAENQNLIYRCQGCRRLITHKAISKGPCGCGMNKIHPTVPSYWEQFKLIFLPWTVSR
jgi:hypothetical protein